MEDIIISTSENNLQTVARVNGTETSIISMGTDIEYFNIMVKNKRWRFKEYFKDFICVEDFYEKSCDRIITHETIHLVLDKEIEVFEKTSPQWDNIDGEYEVSRV